MLKFLGLLIFMIPFVFINIYIYIQIILLLIFLFYLMIRLNINYFINLSYMMYYDEVSYLLIVLRVWLSILILIVRYKIYKIKINYKIFSLVILFMLIFLILTFRMSNVFIFYLFFECSLIPVFILVMGWGYQPERLKAGIYLLLYTLFASLPLIIGIYYFYYIMKRLSFFIIIYFNIDYIFLYVVIILGFLVKIPIFLVHLWLPKAHVESPVRGSIILAGIMLKLGGYGLIRILILVEFIVLKFRFVIIIISLMGGLLVRFYCLNQIDIKMLIAYSSVVHISFVIVGLISLSIWGYFGALVIILGHGLCSSGLFVLVNLVYERFHRRNIFINKGLMSIIPTFCTMWFLILRRNIRAPYRLNLIGEVRLIFRIIFWRRKLMFLVIIIIFIRAFYRLYLFMYRQHGKFNFSIFRVIGGQVREFLSLILHWLPLNIMFIHMDLMLI